MVFTPHKCIACRRCEIICQRVQTVRALALKEVKKRLVIAPIRGQDLSQTPCVQYGQCIEGCLTGALRERDQREELLGLLEDRSKHVVIQTSPASRVSSGEIFFYPPGQDVTGKMVSALEVLGFAAVFDTSFGADEEAEELRGKLLEAKNLPLLTSCCDAWVCFVREFYPCYVGHLSTCKPSQEMLGALIKSYYAALKGLDPQDVVVVSLMPCTAKKAEVLRYGDKPKDVDLVLALRELGRLLAEKDICLDSLPEGEFDPPFNLGSGGG